jgi:hypothetical protein
MGGEDEGIDTNNRRHEVVGHGRVRCRLQHEHQTADWWPMEGEYAGIDRNNRRQVAAHERG